MKHDDPIEMIDVHNTIVYHNLILIHLDFRLNRLIVMKHKRKRKIVTKIMNFKFIYILTHFESLYLFLRNLIKSMKL